MDNTTEVLNLYHQLTRTTAVDCSDYKKVVLPMWLMMVVPALRISPAAIIASELREDPY